MNDPLVKKLQTKAEESINAAYPVREVIKLELVAMPSTRPNKPGSRSKSPRKSVKEAKAMAAEVEPPTNNQEGKISSPSSNFDRYFNQSITAIALE